MIRKLIDRSLELIGIRPKPRLRPFFSYVRMRPRMIKICCTKAVAFDELVEVVAPLISELPSDKQAKPLVKFWEIYQGVQGAIQ